ncbi:MFS transporter [Roseibium sp.]|uniref:MFS transporter n=1 Tax=Roseibium sp. TaxID=1936156 RepID=UPI003A9797D7
MFLNTFRSLKNRNYALWFSGALVSNVGTWMQRTAQDWLVLTELTDHNASAVGLTMALQFGPQILCLPWTGAVADYFDRKKLLFFTQAIMGLQAAILAALTLSGTVELWHVYVLAFMLGCTTAFDAPARHTFAADLAGDKDLPNAVALNSASFNAARMVGPAVAGISIAAIGTGWSFFANAISFLAILAGLAMVDDSALPRRDRSKKLRGGLADGMRYIWQRDDLRTNIVMMFFIGTFGFNFPIYISTISVKAFSAGASTYGILTSCLAVGTVTGALLTAAREKPGMIHLVFGAAGFGTASLTATLMPGPISFGLALVALGVFAMTITTTSTAMIQLSTEPSMRGRVIAIRMAISMGGTPIGAPIAGFIADQFGPRWSMGLAVLAGYAALGFALAHMARQKRLPQPRL